VVLSGMGNGKKWCGQHWTRGRLDEGIVDDQRCLHCIENGYSWLASAMSRAEETVVDVVG
jgi:hypothetical protein